MNIEEAKKIIEILEILGPKVSRWSKGESLPRNLITAAEHDVVYLDITGEEVSEDSELGQRLLAICGVSYDEDDGWVMYV